MSKVGQKIIDGLNDALAFAQGDESRATIVRYYGANATTSVVAK